MTPLGDAGLDGEARARVDRALLADPHLRAELELIEASMSPHARALLWAAFAEECGRHARPAAAVLVALERAAREMGG